MNRDDSVKNRYAEVLEDYQRGLRALALELPAPVWDDFKRLSDDLLVALKTVLPAHHEGVWAVREGECACECRRCFRDDWCVCADCTYDHNHSERDKESATDG